MTISWMRKKYQTYMESRFNEDLTPVLNVKPISTWPVLLTCKIAIANWTS